MINPPTESVENLARGDYIALTHYRGPRSKNSWTGGAEDVIVSGEPLMVLSYAAPFLLISDTRNVTACVDLRRWSFRKLPLEYVKYALAPQHEVRQERLRLEESTAVRKRREKPRPLERDDCRHCGEKMMQRLKSDKEWRFFCQNCERDGGSAVGFYYGKDV